MHDRCSYIGIKFFSNDYRNYTFNAKYIGNKVIYNYGKHLSVIISVNKLKKIKLQTNCVHVSI